MEKTIHQGRNIKRFREMMGIKQEGLASDMGDDWNQKKISMLEAKEIIDERLLEQVAGILKVPVEAIKNFDEEAAVNIISSTFNEEAFIGNSGGTFHINPIDKLLEVIEENKKLNEQNKKLYEELLKVEREKNELMRKILDGKQ